MNAVGGLVLFVLLVVGFPYSLVRFTGVGSVAFLGVIVGLWLFVRILMLVPRGPQGSPGAAGTGRPTPRRPRPARQPNPGPAPQLLFGRHAEEERRVRAWLEALEAGAPERRFEETQRLSRMGKILREHARSDEATVLFTRWLSVARTSGDRLDHPAVRKIFDMAVALYRTGRRTTEAWEMVDQWLTITSGGIRTPVELTALLPHILALYKDSKDLARGEELLGRWLGLAEVGPAHPDLATALRARGEMREALQRPAEAEEDYWRARLLQEERLGPHHPEVLTTIDRHAALLQATGRTPEAETLRAELRSIRGE